MFGTYVSLALSAFVFGSIGILCSAALRATAAATVATYTAVLLLFFLTLTSGMPPGGLPFRSVNAASAIYHSVDMEPFFTTHLPSWLIGVTLNLLAGLLFANMAMTKLEYFNDRRPVPVRGLSTALWAAFVLFLTGNIYGQGAASWNSLATKAAHDSTIGLLGFYFGLLIGALPIFTTGEWPAPGDEEERAADGKPVPSRVALYLRGLLPDAMFRADLPAGAPLMGLWLLLTATSSWGLPAHGPVVAVPRDSLPLLVTIGAVLAAFTGLGNFLSLTFHDRKAVLVLTYLVVAAACLLPFFGYMTWEASGRSPTPHLSWQFLYLTPFLAFLQTTEAPNSFWTSNPPMFLGQTPVLAGHRRNLRGAGGAAVRTDLTRVRQVKSQK